MLHHDHNDNVIGCICGIIGGGIKFLMDIPHDSFGIQFGEAIAIAFASGIAGVFGKHLVTKYFIKKDK